MLSIENWQKMANHTKSQPFRKDMVSTGPELNNTLHGEKHMELNVNEPT